jgi:hypothetical protein
MAPGRIGFQFLSGGCDCVCGVCHDVLRAVGALIGFFDVFLEDSGWRSYHELEGNKKTRR